MLDVNRYACFKKKSTVLCYQNSPPFFCEVCLLASPRMCFAEHHFVNTDLEECLSPKDLGTDLMSKKR